MITGLTLKNSIIAGANNLSNRRAKVDELNVFPVPDGDTGTNTVSYTHLSSWSTPRTMATSIFT